MPKFNLLRYGYHDLPFINPYTAYDNKVFNKAIFSAQKLPIRLAQLLLQER